MEKSSNKGQPGIAFDIEQRLIHGQHTACDYVDTLAQQQTGLITFNTLPTKIKKGLALFHPILLYEKMSPLKSV
jgi:hypothetical protein